MIELTQEQRQAIAVTNAPTMVDPESKAIYVVVPKVDYAEAPRVVRIAWMRRQGLDEDEIVESLRDEPPTSVAEEMKQMKALDHLDAISVPGEVLDKIAVQY